MDEATHCEVGYCSFTNDDNSAETTNQQLIQMLRSDSTGPDYHYIHHNYFADVTPGADENGFETIQLFHGAEGGRGASRTVVEANVFERCSGETEIVSVKCSENIIRHNVFLECRGGLVVRKGSGNLIDGNVFLGKHAAGTGGIRFQGAGQTVINNYMAGLAHSAITLHNGDPENYYDPVTSAVIASNTVVDCVRAVNIGLRHPKRDSSIPPSGVVFTNNILETSGAPIFDPDSSMKNWTLEGNLVSGSFPQSDVPTGILFENPLLLTLSFGIRVPEEGSPAIGQAQGSYPQVTHDVFGSSRPVEGKTIGAVEKVLDRLPVSRDTVGPEAAPDALSMAGHDGGTL
ncbi:hypothetical protein J3R74_002533 [Puniceicoccus vermicola]|uniref:Right-handed parallel beta-helix repeat-containing protein n=1 Tax=Puniceicoccus vermicola TaxID=388746 RepID=A0A7X1AV20_9BACT|nr:right-handed parallel beta-helix repeat-containing protein [Puniceicoccus vermicola]